MSFPASLALFLPLAATGGLLFAVHRRLTSTGSELAEYRRTLTEITAALAAADAAVRQLMSEGRDVAASLAEKIAEADALLGREPHLPPVARPGWHPIDRRQ